jgi:tetratricopeptide (TPR) repeat protein
MALSAARKVASVIPHEAIATAPPVQAFLAVPYWAMVRFGKWDEILSESAPAHDTIFIRGVWHFARGMALSAKGKADEAAVELAALRKIVEDPALASSGASASLNSPETILRIAPDVLEGEMASKKKDYDRAVQLLDRAVRYEDALVYNEPPDWPASVRLTLGAVLLEAGRPVEAEAVYWDDLKKNPENGWALFGLTQALTAQGKKADAERIQARFVKAWSAADVTLTSSRF